MPATSAPRNNQNRAGLSSTLSGSQKSSVACPCRSPSRTVYGRQATIAALTNSSQITSWLKCGSERWFRCATQRLASEIGGAEASFMGQATKQRGRTRSREL
jgi:hypothetical protein